MINTIEKSWRWRPEFAKWLRFPFEGAHQVTENFSQSWQDLFVLTMLRGMKGGKYLEVGANEPRSNNNTYVLSRDFGWSGVSIEFDPSFALKWARARADDGFLLSDALAVDYSSVISKWFGEGVERIDYLQLDIEPSYNTLQVLKRIPLGACRFSVITFETDVYAGDLRARDESRALLREHGYEMVASDVGVLFEPVSPNPIPFEDWWVDPAVVDAGVINSMRELCSNPTLAQRLLFSGASKSSP